MRRNSLLITIFFISILLLGMVSISLANNISEKEAREDLENVIRETEEILRKEAESDNRLVINYLQDLDESWIGKKVSGVKISHDVELKGRTFLGKARGFGKGVNIYLFSFFDGKEAYIWVEKGGNQLPVPQCEEELLDSPVYLSGGIFTERAVQPDNRVVISLCPKDSWIDSLNYKQ